VEPTAEPKNFLKGHSNQAYQRLNDLVIGTHFTIMVLKDFTYKIHKYADKDKYPIGLPSDKGKISTIYRSRTAFLKILKDQTDSKEYEKTLVFAVAEAEDHLASYMRIILRAYPDRLQHGQGTAERSVPFSDVIQAYSKDELVFSVIEDAISNIMRDRPAKYLRYLTNITQSPLSDEIISRFAEICATRDLIVHTQGKINALYINKAGTLARGKIGETIVIDENYFNQSVSNIKDLYGELYSRISSKYQEDEKLRAVLNHLTVMDAYHTLIETLTSDANSESTLREST
jgi:hypothetical protein